MIINIKLQIIIIMINRMLSISILIESIDWLLIIINDDYDYDDDD